MHGMIPMDAVIPMGDQTVPMAKKKKTETRRCLPPKKSWPVRLLCRRPQSWPLAADEETDVGTPTAQDRSGVCC